MILRKYTKQVLFGVSALLFLATPMGCGQESGLGQGEVLSFENPNFQDENNDTLSAKEMSDLELDEGASSEFAVTRVVPYGFIPQYYGFYDYYTTPVAFPVPIAPGVAAVHYEHPFYAYKYFHGYYDDDDGLYFRPDDD